MASEGNDKDNAKPVKYYYEKLLAHLGWRDLGQIYAGGVLKLGDIKGHKALLEAEQLGISL